jgi:hypothetical protein
LEDTLGIDPLTTVEDATFPLGKKPERIVQGALEVLAKRFGLR